MIWHGHGQSDVIFSQYIETNTGTTPKGIEVFNISGSLIDFSIRNLEIYQGTNGGVCSSTATITSGILAVDEVWVIGTSDLLIFSNDNGTGLSGTSAEGFIFNGNDALQLYLGGVLQDQFGVCGSDPGTGWTGGGVSTANNNLQIKDATCDGSLTGFTDPSSRFEQIANGNVMTGFGNAPPSCSIALPELQLVDNTATNQTCGYTIGFGSVISNDSTSDRTFDIANVGFADLTISSLDITGNYDIISPTIIPFVINSGNSQTVTLRFTPTDDGTRDATLTINNNDTNEGSCTVGLTGEGFTPAPNIVVRGVVGGNPTIANGSATSSSLNNTGFAQQTIGVGSQTKTFRIGNEGGTLPLTVSGITLTGDTADFFVTSSFTNPFAPNSSQDFTITFQPTTDSGLRTATVSVTNSDVNKNPYTFVVQGTANCPAVSGSIFPTSGPVGTEVTITSGGNDLENATAVLNGVALIPVSDSFTELVVRLPNTITSGGSLSVELANGCIFSNTFTLINQVIAGCDTSSSAIVDDLFISEVTDSPFGGLGYVEIYNATGAAINFAATNYSLRLYNNGSNSTFSNVSLNSGIVAQNATYIIAFGTSDPNLCNGGANGADGSYANKDLTSNSFNFNKSGNNNLGHDYIGLYSPEAIDVPGGNPEGEVDAWGVFGDETWASGLGIDGSGVRFERITSAPLPSRLYSNSDWIIIDWEDCDDVNYDDIGTYDFSTGVPPSITMQPLDPVFDCETTASIVLNASEGFSGGNNLAYQWYFSAPGDSGFTLVPDNAIYDDVNTPNLNILNTIDLDGYQYYCRVLENTESCFKATKAITLDVKVSRWTGVGWSESPAMDRIIILNEDYDTGTQTSFEACRLIINPDSELIIADDTYVRVQNDITVNGNVIVRTAGAFVQVDDAGIVDGDVLTLRDKISVEKLSAPMNTYREYTYWSSPVFGETVDLGLNEASSSRRYRYLGQNYLDAKMETGNDNAEVDGQDDVDDNGDDWEKVLDSDIMMPGVGYASTHNGTGFTPGQYKYTFDGPFNNGVLEVPIYRNDSEMADNNWNFIGNPYPSAIDVNKFLMTNAVINQNVLETDRAINGAIYLWSHNTPANGNANGNQTLNYSASDYAIINGSDQIAGGDGLQPDRTIPSGQGFFISMSNLATPISASGFVKMAKVVFNNDMRTTGQNSQFFRAENTDIPNKIKLNLTSDNGVFNQISVAYVDGATNGDDGMYYDAPKNLSSEVSASLYSIIDGLDSKKFAIQGKDPNSLSLEEVVPIGFFTAIDVATIYTLSIAQLEGDFMTGNAIYIKDNLLNKIHDLSATDYTFTSETGEFNNRFEIVFNPSTLSVDNNFFDTKDFRIVEGRDGTVTFSVAGNLSIQNIEIMDLLGRTMYKVKLQNATKILDLSNLSQSAYLAKVTLSNAQITTKKFVRRF